MGSDEKKKKKKQKSNSKKRNINHSSENVEMSIAEEEQNGKNKPTDKKKRRREKGNNADVVSNDVEMNIQDNSIKQVGAKTMRKSKKMIRSREADKETEDEGEDGVDKQTAKSKKARKEKKNKKPDSLKDNDDLTGKSREPDQNGVYLISSGDEDCSKGMKKWITEYHQSRPGLQVLQQRIDEFITAHEAQLEQERKEREALAAEGGWTVVVHHKGRKKTTESESGIAVGSVAQAAVQDKMAKKKKKEVGLDFYRFQRREAQRNEIMMLQSKFEQDRKRIQQLRAARKFRPY